MGILCELGSITIYTQTEVKMADLNFPKLGNMAPAFTLLNQRDEKVSLKDFRGKKECCSLLLP